MGRRCVLIVLWALVFGGLFGCASEPVETPEVVVGPPPEPKETVPEEEVGWDDLVPEPDTPARARPHFLNRQESRKAPDLRLDSPGGREREFSPGIKGRITIVVFWSMQPGAPQAAPILVRDIVRRYRRYGVRALGIVEKTRNYRSAAAFLNKRGISMSTYYDDFSALRRMSRAAGAGIKKGVPAFFMLDRERRIRFHKVGLAFSGAVSVRPRTGRTRVTENAPPGKRIEDYLRRLLRED